MGQRTTYGSSSPRSFPVPRGAREVGGCRPVLLLYKDRPVCSSAAAFSACFIFFSVHRFRRSKLSERFDGNRPLRLFEKSDIHANSLPGGKIPASWPDMQFTGEQLHKIDQILVLYTAGDPEKIEGLKLVYLTLVSIKMKR